MAILSGKRLGPYEILSAIGAGGTGEVYRARDTRLDRIVAIKILSDQIADRVGLRERFDREARAIASLNHPHICVLHDIGQQDGTDFLVMEYLEGETLAERLKKGPLPLAQVLQYAIEISDALDKAHRKGITHRDLKPGNIMLTKTGAKLLDFGLAKLKKDTAPANVTLSKVPTEDAVTAQGTILGTLQYMAPEQLEGKEADARTDIFAFGVVVYEMVTGKKAFEGKSQASLIAKILETDPLPMVSLQPMTPPALDRVVKKCLAKEPDDRWHAAKDLCDELKWIAEDGPQVTLTTTAGAKGIRALSRQSLIFGLCALLLGLAIAGLAVWNLKPIARAPSRRVVARFTVALRPNEVLAMANGGLAVSPDGSYIAYTSTLSAGTRQLFLRPMDRSEAVAIPGTDGATGPFFSPDGQWIAFTAGGKLKKVSLVGGTPIVLCDNPSDNPNAGTGSWSPDGTIFFAETTGLMRVPAAGGTPQGVTKIESRLGGLGSRWPEVLPGGQAILYVNGGTTANFSDDSNIIVQSLKTGERKTLIQGGTSPHYLYTGDLVYAQGGRLLAVPFDLQRLEVTGTAAPVLEDVWQGLGGYSAYSLSRDGSIAYVNGSLGGVGGSLRAVESRLVWVNRNGTEQPLPAPKHSYVNPRLSPDGRLVSVDIREQESQVWLYDLSRETLTRLTFEGNTNATPAWTPDGKRIAFQSNKEGSALNLFWLLADGSGGLERLTTSEHLQAPSSWSPDGQLLAFTNFNPTTGWDIWVLRLRDPSAGSGQTHKAQPFLRTPFTEGAPRFSLDGRWLAYVSDESGRYEIYVQPYPGPGAKRQISTDGGTEPAWNRNGRELFYRSGSKMMAVDIATQPSFAAGKPRKLFEGPYLPTAATIQNYDVSLDGQRFLMLKPIEAAEAAATQINVVLNWFEELKQKVPAGKK